MASGKDGASKIGVNPRTYRSAHYIILLADRNDLRPADRAVVDEALSLMNESRQTEAAHQLIKPILDRVYGDQTRRRDPRKTEAKRLGTYECAMGGLTGACEGLAVLTIPYLGEERFVDAIEESETAISQIKRFTTRLKKELNGDDGSESTAEKEFKSLERAWQNAGNDARVKFLEMLQDRGCLEL